MASNDGMAVRKTGGRLTGGQMPCPDCGHPIALPLAAVFAGTPMFCSNCGLKLRVNTETSQKALDALRAAEAIIRDPQGASARIKAEQEQDG